MSIYEMQETHNAVTLSKNATQSQCTNMEIYGKDKSSLSQQIVHSTHCIIQTREPNTRYIWHKFSINWWTHDDWTILLRKVFFGTRPFWHINMQLYKLEKFKLKYDRQGNGNVVQLSNSLKQFANREKKKTIEMQWMVGFWSINYKKA